MSQAQKNQFEQQYNDALDGNREENKIPEQPSAKIEDHGDLSSGNEPMTEDQRSMLATIMELHGEPMDENLTRKQASELIDSKKQNISIPLPGEGPNNFWEPLKTSSTGEEPGTPPTP